MTPYKRGYAAGLKAAADVLQKRARGWGARYDTIHNGAAIGDELEWLSGNIFSLPIQGEVTNPGEQVPDSARIGSVHNHAPTTPDSPGPCVVVPVEPTPEMIQAWHDREVEGAGYIDRNSIVYALYVECYKALLAAAKEEHDAQR